MVQFECRKTSYPAIDTPYEKCTTYFTLWTLWVNSLDGLFKINAVYYAKQLTICEQMISVFSRICGTLGRSG